MKRLLFVDHTPFAGGAQLVLAEHIAQLDKAQYEVHVVCTGLVPLLDERYRRAGATVHHRAFPQLKRRNLSVIGDYWQSIARLRQEIKEVGPDLVITNTARTAYVASVAVWGTRVPLVWWVRDFLYNHWLFATLGRVPKRIICVSQAIKQAYMGPNDPRGLVVYVASNLYKQLPGITSKAIQEERRRWGIGGSDVVVGFMGRLVAEKGPEDLMAAIEVLRKDYPRLKALIVGSGKGQAHDIEDKLKHEVSEKALSEVVLTGYQSNEALYYSMFDLFVLLTRDQEAFATTVVQAMMAGKPVIATAVGGTPELVIDGQTGVLVPPADVPSLVEALKRLLDCPEEAKRLAQAGRERVLQYHREDVATAQLERLYAEVAA